MARPSALAVLCLAALAAAARAAGAPAPSSSRRAASFLQLNARKPSYTLPPAIGGEDPSSPTFPKVYGGPMSQGGDSGAAVRGGQQAPGAAVAAQAQAQVQGVTQAANAAVQRAGSQNAALGNALAGALASQGSGGSGSAALQAALINGLLSETKALGSERERGDRMEHELEKVEEKMDRVADRLMQAEGPGQAPVNDNNAAQGRPGGQGGGWPASAMEVRSDQAAQQGQADLSLASAYTNGAASRSPYVPGAQVGRSA